MDIVVIEREGWTCPQCKLIHEVNEANELDGGSFVVEGGGWVRCICGYRKFWSPAGDKLTDLLSRRN